MSSNIIDKIKIMRLQSFHQYNKLNPVEVSIQNSKVNIYLNRFSHYKYRFIRNNLLFTSSLTNDTNICVTCNRLNDAKYTLINGGKIKAWRVVNINQIELWGILKGKRKWVNVPLTIQN